MYDRIIYALMAAEDRASVAAAASAARRISAARERGGLLPAGESHPRIHWRPARPGHLAR